jgi:hypothetical protein
MFTLYVLRLGAVVGPSDKPIQALADEHGADAVAVRELLATLRERVGADHFYVFWTAGGAAQAPGARRERTLLAFQTPDAALAFAQRNRLQNVDRPRLRRLELIQLVGAALRTSAIVAILFVGEEDHPTLPVGQLPPGVRVARDELLRSLHIQA